MPQYRFLVTRQITLSDGKTYLAGYYVPDELYNEVDSQTYLHESVSRVFIPKEFPF